MAESIIAVIPIRGSDEEFRDGPMPRLGERPLIEYTLLAARESRRLDRIIVSTDREPIAQACRAYGVDAPFLRPPRLSAPSASGTDVLRHAVEWLESQEGYRADWVVKLEITHPFRPKGLIDWVIDTTLAQGVDSAVLVYEDAHSYWTIGEDGQPQRIGHEVEVPRHLRRGFYRDLSGLVTMTRAENLRAGRLFGNRVGLIPWRDPFALVDTHERGGASQQEAVGRRLAELLAPEFNRSRDWNDLTAEGRRGPERAQEG